MTPALDADIGLFSGQHLFDVVIVGAGFAGSVLAIKLAQSGLEIAVIDPYDSYPDTFQCEKLLPSQIEQLESLGLADILEAPNLWGKSGKSQNFWGVRYKSLVNAARARWPENIHFVRGKALRLQEHESKIVIETNRELEIGAKLAVLASGPGARLHNQLDLAKRVISKNHSIAVGLNFLPPEETGFDFAGLRQAGCRAGDGVGFAGLFQLATANGVQMRVNLFMYDQPSSPRVNALRQDPKTALLEIIPELRKYLQKAIPLGVPELRITDLYKIENPARDRIVLLGEARANACPASAMGFSRILTEIKLLSHDYLPNWLDEDRLDAKSIGEYYRDPAITTLDQKIYDLSINNRLRALQDSPISRLQHFRRKCFGAEKIAAVKVQNLRQGDEVHVRSAVEILNSLAPDGTLEGLPFMPEMVSALGDTFKVHRQAERICIEGHDLRRITSTLMLTNLRCDGSAHNGCLRDCLALWKHAWLRSVTEPPLLIEPEVELDAREKLLALVTKNGTQRYFCQSTQLAAASIPLRQSVFLIVWHEYRCGEISFLTATETVLRAFADKILTKLKRPKFEFIVGKPGKKSKGALGLRAGEWVRVKDKEAIRETLDERSQNMGLSFEPQMNRYIGKIYQVERIVDRIIHEEKASMIKLQATVMLKDLYCSGICNLGCSRANPLFWREAWLERVSGPPS